MEIDKVADKVVDLKIPKMKTFLKKFCLLVISMLGVLVGVVDMGVIRWPTWWWTWILKGGQTGTDREDRCRPEQTTWHICLGKV